MKRATRLFDSGRKQKICNLNSVHRRHDTCKLLKKCSSLYSHSDEVHLVVADGKVYENYNYVQIHDARLRPFGIKLRKQGKKATYNTHENFPRQLMSKRYINYFLYKPVSLILEWSEDYDATKRFNFIITATPPTQKRFSKFYNASLDVNKYPLLSE